MTGKLMIPNEFPFTWKMIFIRVPPPFITQYLMLHAFPHSIYPYISTDHWLMLLLLLLKHLKKKKNTKYFSSKKHLSFLFECEVNACYNNCNFFFHLFPFNDDSAVMMILVCCCCCCWCYCCSVRL